MKQVIRLNTFETNSSSMHSLTFSTQDEVSNLLCDAKELIDSLDSKEELAEAITKIDLAKMYLLKAYKDLD